jgi:hypothetical protein
MAAMMNHSFYSADRATHRRVLMVSLAAAMLVSAMIVETSPSTASRAPSAKLPSSVMVKATKENACNACADIYPACFD